MHFDPVAIDRTRPFIPDEFCPFTHLPAAAALPSAVTLRQNQLHAIYVLEMIRFFEGHAGDVLGALALVHRGSALEPRLRSFIAEETEHSATFSRLALAAAPELYPDDCTSFFIRPPRWTSALRWLLCRHPRVFPFWPWLMLIMEEKALGLSRAYIRDAATLEPHFAAVHRWHAADEAGHLACDEDLIAATWDGVPRAWRGLNARLLAMLLCEFFLAPKRGALRLVGRLATEFPAHRAAILALGPQLATLPSQPAWRRAAYSRELMPRALHLMATRSEMAPVARIIDPRTPALAPGASAGYTPTTRER